jgi:assimilatory nitrate reductase catalytic subunit
MSRTGTVGKLFGHVAEPMVQMNAQDMARRQLKDGDLVHLTSKRGSILLPARASAEIGMSQAFVAMHWGEEYLSGCSSTGTRLAGINALTTPAYCPASKQPELKHAAVKILKAELPWSLLAMAWLPEDAALAARRALQPLMAMFPFATCVPFSGSTQDAQRSGILFRAAAHDAPADALLAQIEVLLGLQGADTLRYADRRRGQRRSVRLVRRGDESAGLEAFLLGGDTSAEAWIATLLREELPAQSYGRLLLSPGARAPLAVQSRGKPVCTCFNVTDLAIQAELGRRSGTADERLAALQGTLKCGTNCGSCIPELKRMVRVTPSEATAEAP